MNTLPAILVLLTSAVLAVALFRAFKLPAILAYILVGVLLGPHALGVLPDMESNRELAEFGIVFLMFSIGLEFSLPQLYAMRNTLFGLGGLQVGITIIVTILLGLWLVNLDWRAGLVLGGAFAMSSTAIVSKLLVERLDLNARHGRLSIGILLFQDIAVVPLLVFIPALAHPEDMLGAMYDAMLKAIIVLWILFVLGKHIVSRWFAIVAAQRSRELFVMNLLMVTLILAFATKLAGLSYALGAFIAGMLISETRFRYQVEADIAAFRDILLGLFFITIGMMLNGKLVLQFWPWVLLLIVVLIAFKAVLVAVLSRFFGYEPGVALRTGVTLAQGGEFSFVLLSLGFNRGLIDPHTMQIALAAVLFSMMLAPFLIQHNLQITEFFARSYTRNRLKQLYTIQETGKQLNEHVIICGYGRSGQALGRFLREEHIPYIALDIDSARVQEAAAAGDKVMYGDASRRLVLEAAGAARAKVMVISYDDPPSAIRILHLVHDYFPDLPVIVRTVDDTNLERFREAGAAEVVPEVLEGSLMLASQALVAMGVPLSRVIRRIRVFREENYKSFRGFFHGATDQEQDGDLTVPRLHSVQVSPFAYCIGKRLRDIYFDQCKVEITAIRRGEHPLEARHEFVFAEGDVVVMLARPQDLIRAEKILLTGKDK